jgi:hypothetical protein
MTVTAPRVLVIALEDHRRSQMVNDLGRVVRAGGAALLIRRDSDGWPDLPRGVRVFDTAARYLSTMPIAPLAADPRWAAARLLGRRRSVRTAPWWPGLRRTRAVQAALPQLDWAVVRRHYLAAIDPGTLTQIIPTTTAAWPVAWHVARLSPNADLRSGLDREALSGGPSGAT